MRNDVITAAVAVLGQPKMYRIPAPNRDVLAKTWVENAIAAGWDPFVRQEPLSSDDSGEWKIVTYKTASSHSPCPGMFEELWDEIFIILATMGRLKQDDDLELWHGDLLIDNCSSRALALRLRMARQALNLDHEQFYGSCGIDRTAAAAFEAGHPSFASLSSEYLDELCDRHDIPEAWLWFGTAMEIEA